MNDYEIQQQKNLQIFYEKVEKLLDYKDKNYLYNVFKEYQNHKQVDVLVSCLNSALDNPEKKGLLKDIRNILPPTHVDKFDELSPVSELEIVGMYSPHQTSKVNNHGHPPRHRASSSDEESMHNEIGTFRTLTILKKAGQDLGISIRGGSEHGLGIFVSDVQVNSVAAAAGIEVGDNIIEVNDVSFGNIASSSAVKVFNASPRLKITIKRVGKVPGFRMAREKTSWYDTVHGKLVEGNFRDNLNHSGYTSGMPMLNGMRERRINLTVDRQNQYLGFNIRGGNEYTLGIYVSKVDAGGMAEQKGIKVGDQIIDVNGESFEKVTHLQAVDFIKAQKQLVLTVRDVGRYPMFKEIYAHFSWLDNTNTQHYSQKIPSESDSSTITINAHVHADETFFGQQFPQESRIEFIGDDDVENHNLEPKSSTFITEQVHHREETIALKEHLLTDSPDKLNTNPSPMINSKVIIPGENVQYNYESDPDDDNFFIDESDFKPVAESTIIQSKADEKILESIPIEDKMPSGFEDEIVDSEKNSVVEAPIVAKKAKRKTESAFGAYELSEFSSEKSSLSEAAIIPRRSERKTETAPLEWSPYKDNNKKPESPGQEKNTTGNNEESDNKKKIKRIRTFREAVLKKMSFMQKDKPTVTEGKSSRFKLSGFSMKRKSKDLLEDNKSRKSTSTDSSGGKPRRVSWVATDVSLRTRVRPKSDDITMMSQWGPNHTTAMISQLAKKLLNEDEALAVDRHVQRYQIEGDVEALVTPLLMILDRPEKMLLLREIRDIIAPVDLGRFDSMVSRHEIEAYEELATMIHSHSPVVIHRGKADLGPPKKTLMAPVPDHRGNFQLKTQQEYEDHRKKKIEVERLQRERLVSLRREISERQKMDHVPFQKLHAKNGEFPIDIGSVRSTKSKGTKKVTKEMISEPIYAVVNKDKMKEKILDEIADEATTSSENPTIVVVQHKNSDKNTVENKDKIEENINNEMITSRESPTIVVLQHKKSDKRDEPEKASCGFKLETSPSWRPEENETGNIYETIENVRSKLDEMILAKSESLKTNNKDDEEVEQKSDEEASSPKKGILKVESVENNNKKSLNWGNDCVIRSKSDASDYAELKWNTIPDDEVKNSEDEMGNNDSGLGADVDTSTTRTRPDGSDSDVISAETSSKAQASIPRPPVPPPPPPALGPRSTDIHTKPPIFHAPPPPIVPPSPDASDEETVQELEYLVVEIPKGKPSLGISISGGADSMNQPEARIENVFPHGAISENPKIKPGMLIIKVGNNEVQGLTHEDVVETIRKSYNSLQGDTMQLTLAT